MNNVYDKAHDLARVLAKTEEYQNYKKNYDLVMKNPDKAERINSYRKKLMDWQVKNMGSNDPDEEELDNIKELNKALMMDTEIRDFMEAEMSFLQIYNDVNTIITDAIQLED